MRSKPGRTACYLPVTKDIRLPWTYRKWLFHVIARSVTHWYGGENNRYRQYGHHFLYRMSMAVATHHPVSPSLSEQRPLRNVKYARWKLRDKQLARDCENKRLERVRVKRWSSIGTRAQSLTLCPTLTCSYCEYWASMLNLWMAGTHGALGRTLLF